MKISWFWAKFWAVIETSVMGKEDWFKNWDLADRIGMHQFWHSKSSVTLVLNTYEWYVFDISLYSSLLKHFRKIIFYFVFFLFLPHPPFPQSFFSVVVVSQLLGWLAKNWILSKKGQKFSNFQNFDNLFLKYETFSDKNFVEFSSRFVSCIWEQIWMFYYINGNFIQWSTLWKIIVWFTCEI